MGLMYDIASVLFKKAIDGEGDDGIRRAVASQGKMNSITKMAKDAIFSYPVLFSEGIVANDEDLMYAICSYLETQYATFTMIAMGLNPVFAGNDPKSHIATFYSEEYESLDFGKDYKYIPNAEISMSNAKIKITDDHLKEYKYANEADTSTDDKKDDDKKKEEKGKPMLPAKLGKLESKIRSSDPTIVNVKLKMAENKHEIEFPIAVKAMPRFVTSDESERIFSYLRDDKPLVRLVKLLSGEVGLFKDIIFQVERAKKDKELYSKLGRHPWFREMIARRDKRKVNGFAQLIPGIQDFIKNSDTDILPICSLCVTKDEIERGFSNLWVNIKKSNENVMDKLMLLCLCVVDTTTRVVEFDFYGLKNNVIVRADTLIKENSGKGDDKGKDIEKLLQTLIYKV